MYYCNDSTIMCNNTHIFIGDIIDTATKLAIGNVRAKTSIISSLTNLIHRNMEAKAYVEADTAKIIAIANKDIPDDVVSPLLRITYPTEYIVKKKCFIKAVAADNNLKEITLYFDNEQIAYSTTETVSTTINLAKYRPGIYTIKAVASDTYGNVSVSEIKVKVVKK